MIKAVKILKALVQNEYEIIDGKPHLGLWYGYSIPALIDIDENQEPLKDNPSLVATKSYILESLTHQKNSNPDLTSRHVEWIFRPPNPYGLFDPFAQLSTIGLKWMIWGRAYKVMRLTRKKIKRYRKKLINGHRKYVRIDKK